MVSGAIIISIIIFIFIFLIIIILLIPQTVKINNRLNDLSVQFACNNYCTSLLYSIIIILIINS